jgi:N-acetyl-gamma-glutamyl-phosphate reductase
MTNKYAGCRVAVLGASGFAGAELLRILAGHPGLRVVAAAAASRVGQRIQDAYPGLPAEATGGECFVSVPDALALEPDLVFASLPHGASRELLAAWEGPAAVDLGADFRLDGGDWAYGLTEWHRGSVTGARRVANPGCYPTASLLAIAPLLAAGAISSEGIHIDAQSGVSGAGRATGEGFDFVAVNENLRPYSPTGHKHIAEMEQQLGTVAGAAVRVSFVPHLVPVTRGLLATCSAPLAAPASTEDLVGILAERYRDEPFVRVLGAGALPETRRVNGTNVAEVTVRADEHTGRAIAFGAIDNLGKGAAGQAVQNANLMLGFDEGTALAGAGLLP